MWNALGEAWWSFWWWGPQLLLIYAQTGDGWEKHTHVLYIKALNGIGYGPHRAIQNVQFKTLPAPSLSAYYLRFVLNFFFFGNGSLGPDTWVDFVPYYISTFYISLCLSLISLSLSQQTLPVDLSSNAVRSSGSSSSSFSSTSAFDPCCPGNTSRPPAYVSQATPGPSQPSVVDTFSPAMVAQPQPQSQLSSCRHYMHPSCKCKSSSVHWRLYIL